MGIFSFTKKNATERGTSDQEPWQGRPAIYDHIQSHFEGSPNRLNDAGQSLPDEQARFEKAGLKWVPGGMDGAMGHHWGAGGDADAAKRVSDLIIRIARRNAAKDRVELYRVLSEDAVLDYIDTALEQVVKAGIPAQPHLHALARFLATNSPDRGPVKLGIALLGLVADPDDKAVVLVLGHHEEFTLYSAVALANMSSDPESDLWSLAKSVEGWGRIELVDRLAKTTNPAIKRWLLREGYRNRIMYEYTAYACATAGDLRSAITADEVDPELLGAAGDIIRALITGGPAKDMNDYDHAAVVVTAYLRHIAPKADDLQHYLVVKSVRDYLKDENWNRAAREKNGWDDTLRQQALTICQSVLDQPRWSARAREGLNSSDELVFSDANMVAADLGIDTWEMHWRRLREKPLESGRWFHVMHGASAERARTVIAYAVEVLPLDKVATGPTDEMGLGKEYEVHSCLDFIVQDLGGYPGEGWPLIAASLKSPVVRNRNMALKALNAWGVENWPKEALHTLRAAEGIEPEEDVRKTIHELLAKKPNAPD